MGEKARGVGTGLPELPPRLVEDRTTGELLEMSAGLAIGPGAYEAISPEDQLRRALREVEHAIMMLALKNIDDDGRIFRPYQQGEPGYWDLSSRLIRKRLSYNEVQPMVQEVRDLINSYRD